MGNQLLAPILRAAREVIQGVSISCGIAVMVGVDLGPFGQGSDDWGQERDLDE